MNGYANPRKALPALGRLSLLALLLALVPVGDAACASVPQRVAVPSYFTPGPQWDRLAAAAPTAGIAVINPNNGPGASPDPAYAAAVQKAQDAGLTVLGYAHTRYGQRPLDEVKADIDAYRSWYGVTGIFFDEAATDCALAASYYAPLRDHVKAQDAGAKVVLNPGMQTNECYLEVADVLVTFESSYARYASGYSAPAWVEHHPADRFWHLVYDARNTRAMNRAVRLSKERNAGWVYVTPDVLPNPWDTLPPETYWQAELSAAAR